MEEKSWKKKICEICEICEKQNYITKKEMPYQSISLQISVTPHSRNLAPQNYNIFPSTTKNHQKKTQFLQFPQFLQFLLIVIFGIFVFFLFVLSDLWVISRASISLVENFPTINFVIFVPLFNFATINY